MPRTVAIIQARMGSKRLPGKILQELLGKPMLFQEWERVSRSSLLDEVAVATTENRQDDVVAEECRRRGVPCFRGSETDVLDRYVRAAREFQADVIVRLTADCPLLDGEAVDQVVSAWQRRQPGLAYASNAFPLRTFPHGLDVEVLGRAALEAASVSDRDPLGREHVTLYVKKHPDQFPAFEVNHEEDLSGMRWTVDAPEDLHLVRTIYRHFGHARFGWKDAVAAQRQHPEWSQINGHVRQNPAP